MTHAKSAFVRKGVIGRGSYKKTSRTSRTSRGIKMRMIKGTVVRRGMRPAARPRMVTKGCGERLDMEEGIGKRDSKLTWIST